MIPNFEGVMGTSLREVKFRTNEDGNRGKTTIKDLMSAEKRIVFLGDSFTFGIYVEEDASFVTIVERDLAQKFPSVKAINLGSCSYGPYQHYYRYLEIQNLLKPDLVVLVFYSGNDFWDVRPMGVISDGRLVNHDHPSAVKKRVSRPDQERTPREVAQIANEGSLPSLMKFHFIKFRSAGFRGTLSEYLA